MEDASLGTAEAEQLGPSLWVLGLAGEHDLSTAPRVDVAFAQIVMTGTTVIVEFSQTSFSRFDGRWCARQALAWWRDVAAGRTTGSAVRRTLDLIGITDLLGTFETREDALQAVPAQDMPPD
jgi:hypothetical protein